MDKRTKEERKLAIKLDRLSESIERLRFEEYLKFVTNRKRMLWNYFVGGLARGLGSAIGFTILGALLLYFLTSIASKNLPFISDFIKEIMNVINNYAK